MHEWKCSEKWEHVILLAQIMKNSGARRSFSRAVKECSEDLQHHECVVWSTDSHNISQQTTCSSTNNSTKCFSEYKCTDSLKHFYFHIYVIKGNLRYGSRVTFCLPAAPRTEKVFRFKLALTGPPAQKEQKALAWSNAAREKRTKHVVLSFIQIPVLQKQKAQPEKRGQAP